MNCPLCGQKEPQMLTDRLRNGEPLRVLYCPDCDAGYLEDRKTGDELKAYYRDAYRKEYKPDLRKQADAGRLFDIAARFQEDRIARIERYLRKEASVLDVGCSSGAFLYRIKDKVQALAGVEPDPEAARFASRACGCPVYAGYLPETPLPKGSFDVVCSFQVMEHVEDPLAFLLQMKEYVKDDGVLCVEVPNLRDALVSAFELPNYRRFYFRSAHLFYFGDRGLRLLMERAGLEGDVFYSQDYHFVNHMNWALSDKPQPSAEDGMGEPAFPLRRDADPDAGARLNGFLRRVNREYKALLEELGITSKIGFIARKKRD
ncbi:class I SAM-dependent methyltransferase [Cohnella algarum]|uniref:class I SAM-dependent methyltransferase n=1 Tax=Cohnella algarum TaxID=2044859 RepID=UPI00196844AC|nr:class I SAM-dependent methyltransferase [Cohnella algarum]MBN2982688.1 class I SAM-dependent methyltransferase [Cohnella algarum]